MKKFSLGKLKILESEILDRTELAKIYGGADMSLMNCSMWSCHTGFGCYQSNCCCYVEGSGTSGICVDRIGGDCPTW